MHKDTPSVFSNQMDTCNSTVLKSEISIGTRVGIVIHLVLRSYHMASGNWNAFSPEPVL